MIPNTVYNHRLLKWNINKTQNKRQGWTTSCCYLHLDLNTLLATNYKTYLQIVGYKAVPQEMCNPRKQSSNAEANKAVFVIQVLQHNVSHFSIS